MKILKTEPYEENEIILTIEEYPFAQPIFRNDLTEQELAIALQEWAINQDEIAKASEQNEP
jgi:hypothetical protein